MLLTAQGAIKFFPCWAAGIFFIVIDERTLAEMNGKYSLPPDAGPAWCAAHQAGLDMSLIEDTVKLTPEQRLAEHQQVIDFLLEVHAAGVSHAPE